MRKVRNHKKIIDPDKLRQAFDQFKDDHSADSVRKPLLELLKKTYQQGFDEIHRRCDAGESGMVLVRAQSYLTDEIIKFIYDVATGFIFFQPNPTKSEQLCLVAIGGYGRGEMAPYSDIDLLFLLPYKQTPWGEQVVEYMLYLMWDMGLKVGHATRTVNECIRLSKSDLTIQTSLLESRYIWGQKELFDEFLTRYDKEVIAGHEPEFIEGKLAERDERHHKMGDSRYVVEPNLKDGKGGLRDLQTLYWISKFIYGVHSVSEVVKKGVFTKEEYRQFQKAARFFYTVRCHLHYLVGRPEERITFDVQKTLAEKLGYADRPGSSGVERFMKHYFLTAKNVGDLTRIFCSYLEAKHKRKPRLKMPSFGLKKKKIDGFPVDGSRISITSAKTIADNPVEMIRIFYVAQKYNLDIHPRALRLIRQNLKKIDREVRNDPVANHLFLEILTYRKGPGSILRMMNEAGVFGRFIPDFGRVVAQMQYDMYHVYTVDEHTIRAIELLSEVEQGTLAEDHPLANEIIHKVISRRVLYVAVLLHDIAKGRKGDHSVLGEEVARKLCPRFGLSAAETETVAWLVRWHLLMTMVAFKRDLNDPKTIADFANQVQSPERLRLLLVLTVVDIRAVGPKIWNGWKGQLLRDLYYNSEEYLLGGQIEGSHQHRIRETIADLRKGLSKWSDSEFEKFTDKFYDSFWLALDDAHLLRLAETVREADEKGETLTITTRSDEFREITELTIYTPDHPGLFARITGAIAVSGASIQDAKIFTTKDGMALDTFWIQESDESAFDDKTKQEKLKQNIRDTLLGKILPREVLEKRRSAKVSKRTAVFTVEPVVLIDNNASNTFTVIEVNGLDRVGFLYDLSRTLMDLKVTIGSAHIATYGERAIAVFFLKDLFGHKITHKTKLNQIEKKLLEVLSEDKSSGRVERKKTDKKVLEAS
ncbi:[protein-PII] uridylyltransferase [Emcibacter nanhaiensis]|uniref:Bifunctional uridylyltransferase/uridylyl-removing enzyme n=1 Tax=Emcibacter nanhaiensis TaxID=1505037 RepID=A0A501PI44_9PROT|nr:[protein-PII] uridylyltransferase [Emcibacter nanhaiensis]TPD59777.1 [protein-PII] uridylyltransferase [Emcibacter nanhaiensis]